MARMYNEGIPRYQDDIEVTVLDNDESFAKMSGGGVDVEPYLDSRNTKRYGAATQILKTKGDQNRRSSIG